MNTTTAHVTVISVKPLLGHGQLLGLADVEVVLDEVPILICGVQIRGAATQSSIHLPCYRAPDGQWKSAIILPEEVKDAMGEIVQQAAMDAGILRHVTEPV